MKKVILSMVAVATVTMADTNITPVVADGFFEGFHFKNDLRLRYESIERDDKANKYRNRYRLRLGAKVDLVDNLQLVAGMRSGFANPTSGNQTFKSDKSLNDYFLESLRFNILGLTYKSDNSTYKVGRQPNMIYKPIKSQLIWDNDVSMNGINYQYKDDSKIITLGVNQPTLEEKANSKDNVNLFIAQYVHKTKLNSSKLNLGAGLYYYDGLKGNTTLFGSSKGNSLDASDLYTNDYHIVEAFAELQLKDVLGKPLKIAASVAHNIAASDDNFGYDLGIQLGKAKKVGQWQVKYSYTDIEKDAVYGAYSDSDNFGGGTAASGHALRGKYKAGKNLYLAGNFFSNKLDESKSSTGKVADYNRVQLDMIYKF